MSYSPNNIVNMIQSLKFFALKNGLTNLLDQIRYDNVLKWKM